MWLIAGLGNPGQRYENTPHNLGFDVVDALAKRHGWSWRDLPRWRGWLAEGEYDSQRVTLMKPQTYMNLSGEAIVPYLRYHKIEQSRLVVISDDVALPMGKMRVRDAGSDGGQKGLLSVIQQLGSNEFARLRVGIDPGIPIRDLAGFVLAKMAGTYRDDALLMIEKSADCLETMIRQGVHRAANRFNGFDARKSSGETK